MLCPCAATQADNADPIVPAGVVDLVLLYLSPLPRIGTYSNAHTARS